MNFKTKFNLEDRAWYMKDNKPIEVIVSAIHIFHVGTSRDHIKYSAKNITNSVSWLDHQHLFEDTLFRSKSELLKSLFGEVASCKGTNCSAINGIGHSKECIKEHDQAISGETPDIPGFEGTRESLQNLGK